MSEILLTIITPVFNRADSVGRCVDSVVDQRYHSVELLIIDDGSSDASLSIVQGYAAEHSFIKVHSFAENRGVNAARNWGIANSRGKYILFLDSDDCLVDKALMNVEKQIVEHEGYNHFLFMQDDRLFNYEKFGLLGREGEVVIPYVDFLLNRVYGDFIHVMRANIVKKYPFDERLRIYEGLNYLRIFKENRSMLFSESVVAKIDRGRGDSVSNDYKLRSKKAIGTKYVMLKELLASFKADYYEYDNDGAISVPMAKEAYLLGLASSDYELDFIDEFLQNWNTKIGLIPRFIRVSRLGLLVRNAIILRSNINSLLRK